MVGSHAPYGPGGRNCTCCGDRPGKDRIVRRRTLKRSEKQQWRRELRRGEN